MRFLAKRADSRVLVEGLVYQKGGHNGRLRALLAEEQLGFCAYSERRIRRDHTTAVEHFDDRLKADRDDYYNYYTVLQSVNQRKRRRQRAHDDAGFMQARWFQEPGAIPQRITYVPEDHVFEEVDLDDTDAAALLDLLGVNDEDQVQLRKNHVERVRSTLHDADHDPVAYFRRFPEELDFLTALECVLQLDLEALAAETTPRVE